MDEKVWHTDPWELLDGLKLPDGITLYQWTDCTNNFVGIGIALVEMDSNNCRSAKVPSLDQSEYVSLIEKLRGLGIFTNEFIDAHFGTWFIHGGS